VVVARVVEVGVLRRSALLDRRWRVARAWGWCARRRATVRR